MPRRRRSATTNPGQTDFADALFTGSGTSEVHESAAISLPSPALSPLSALVPVYGVRLVRTGSLITAQPKITSPRDAVAILAPYLEGVDREHFVALLLDVKAQLIGVTTISIGDLTSALVHPREVFKPAILASAASILVAHNHPSTDPTPSQDDIAITRRLGEAGALLGIEVLDHVIFGSRDRWVSLVEKGYYCRPSNWSARATEPTP